MPEYNLSDMSSDAVKEVSSRTIFTIDGLWFLAVEEKFGFDAAFELNQRVWAKCAPIHARRVLKHLETGGKSPLEALVAMLFADPITSLRRPQVVELSETRLVFRCLECPTQFARTRDGKGVFNGIPGCTLLFQAYAEAVNPRIQARCVSCGAHPEDPEYWCEWEFTLALDKKD